jgi:hypothetical protein
MRKIVAAGLAALATVPAVAAEVYPPGSPLAGFPIAHPQPYDVPPAPPGAPQFVYPTPMAAAELYPAGSPLAGFPVAHPQPYYDVSQPAPPVPSSFAYPKPVPQWEFDFGGRYVFGSGQTTIQLFGGFPNRMVSQLTYSNLTGNGGEIFGRVEHLSGFFLKGYLGGALRNTGNLKDEDFPPVSIIYSSTNSDQKSGSLKYATVDFGWDWRSKNARLGFFAGYLYYAEHLNAYGCTQTASNPFICVPPIPNDVLAITSDATWNAARFGVVGQWWLGYGLSLTAEVAWLPVGVLSASDFHWLRPDLIKPVPEKGDAFDEFQLEAVLKYQFSPNFSVGVGGRLWRIGTTAAEADFAGGTQAINFRTETWGAFVQASYKFGELPPSNRFGL